MITTIQRPSAVTFPASCSVRVLVGMPHSAFEDADARTPTPRPLRAGATPYMLVPLLFLLQALSGCGDDASDPVRTGMVDSQSEVGATGPSADPAPGTTGARGDDSHRESSDTADRPTHEAGTTATGDHTPGSDRASPTTTSGASQGPLTSECEPAQTTPDALIIPSESGAIRGELRNDLRRWLGVPYAAPPVGSLRWRPPEPAPCRDTVLDATTPAPACPQADLDTGAVSGDEDCLQLNIWAPNAPAPSEGWPILVFIHGGGNIIGSASETLVGGARIYEGERLAERGAVVVALNYRLGAFGWLALDALNGESEDEVSGNWGLRDQQLALQWVREHIPAIGGDPERLLLFGESAGAVNTVMHLASPASTGLFSAAAVMSGGTSTTPIADAIAIANERVAASDCSGASGDTALLTCLRALPAETVLAQFPGRLTIDSFSIAPGRTDGFGPVLDGVLLPEPPLQRIAAGRHNQVPVMVGTTAEEMALLLPTQGITSEAAFEQRVRASFFFLEEADLLAMLDLYAPSAYPSPAAALIALYSDLRFVCPATRLIEALDEGQDAPVFRYWFSRRAETAQGETPAAHGRELLYLFGTLSDLPLFTPRPGELRVARDMQQAWLSFANDAAPTVEHGPPWEKWAAERDNAFDFRDPPAVLEGVRTEECEFWDELALRVRTPN